MGLDVAVCMPWRAGDRYRERAFDYVSEWWRDGFDWRLSIADDQAVGPMNRSRARNRAAQLAGDWDVAVFADADTIGDRRLISEAAKAAGEIRQIVYPFDRFEGLSAPATDDLYAGRPPMGRKKHVRNSPGGIFAIGRPLFDELGGFDEGFTGWGFEDVSFAIAARTLGGNTWLRYSGTIVHLWHPVSPEKRRDSPEWAANLKRRHRYGEAEGDPDAMRRLLEELGVTTK